MGLNDLSTRNRKICFVVGSQGAALPDAESLASAGWEIHLLYCRREGDRAPTAGCVVHWLEDQPIPATCLVPNGTPGCGPSVYESNLIRYGVESLHRIHRFDAIVFPSWQAAGFRCVQAKRAGVVFLDAALIVRLDRLNQWEREAEKRCCSPDDVFLDYCERYSFENADGQGAVSAPLLEYARNLGWNVAAKARAADITAAWIEGLVPAARRAGPAPVVMTATPAATVAVSHYNLGQFLPETLASLAKQSCTDMEVLVIDDGSTCADSVRVFAEQENLYPQFQFIRQANVGLGAARNRALAQAKGEFFIPVDADNIAAPHMVEVFLGGMRSRSDLSAMTCFFTAFANTTDISEGNFLHQYCPTGGPHLAACAFNVYGDANAIFRTTDLRSVGGFVTDRDTYCHDWETFVKLVHGGRWIGVIPEYLFYYRRRADGMSAVMTDHGANTYPFMQRMISSFADAHGGASDPESRMVWETLAGYLLRDGANEPKIKRGIARRLFRGVVNRLTAAGRPAWNAARSQGRKA
jgi:glycosyltransferase involved in cell wall biosynthesis